MRLMAISKYCEKSLRLKLHVPHKKSTFPPVDDEDSIAFVLQCKASQSPKVFGYGKEKFKIKLQLSYFIQPNLFGYTFFLSSLFRLLGLGLKM